MVYTLEQTLRIAKDGRRKRTSIVFTSGVFDLFHVGHLYILHEAWLQGNVLIVGLNSDRSVRRIKPGRPIIPEKDRAEIIASLMFEANVTLFNENTPEKTLRALKPDIYVKGKGWTKDKLPEAKLVESYGGKVVIIDKELESTTAIIERVRAL